MSDEARFEIRHGTQDIDVYAEVLLANQYKLPDSISEDSLIVDIGANIGCFAVACLLRGAGGVLCLEPSKDNFQPLINNVASWPGKAACFNVGVWRSDIEEAIAFSPGGGTAVGCCFPSSVAPSVPRANSVSLDDILFECTGRGERNVQILKIDAEYSEYPILYTSKRLNLVDQIIGEVHKFRGDITPELYYQHPEYKNTAEDMARFLTDQGFTVELQAERDDDQTNTLFWATRSGSDVCKRAAKTD